MSLSPRIDAIEQSIRNLAPNLIINGAMEFWQRSTSFNAITARGYNSIDRFMIGCSGSGSACTNSRSTVVPNSQFRFSAQQVETGDAIGNTMLACQRIEGALIRPYVGRTMTLSCWVQFTGVVPANPRFVIYSPASGVEDSWTLSDPLPETNQGSSPTFSFVDGVWQRVSYTFVVPAACSNGLQVLWTSQSYDGVATMRHTGWMLTEGNQAPTYFYRNTPNMQAEIAACQRYYEKSYDLDVAPGTNTHIGRVTAAASAQTTSDISLSSTIPFKVRKRFPPSFAFWTTTGTSGSWSFMVPGSSSTTNFPVIINSSSRNGFEIKDNTGSSIFPTTTTFLTFGHYTADGEL